MIQSDSPTRDSATIDTSVLCSLQSAQLLEKLSVLFNRILIPERVHKELSARPEANRPSLEAIEDLAFFHHCTDYDPLLVQWLLHTRKHRKEGKDRGEAEAVIQAAKHSAVVLMDDHVGRVWAQRHSVECHGTIWLCRELRRRGFITALRPHFVRIVQQGHRQPLKHMNRYLQEFDETLITEQEYEELTGSA